MIMFYISVAILKINELVKGQKTKVFQDNPIPEYEVCPFMNMFMCVSMLQRQVVKSVRLLVYQ